MISLKRNKWPIIFLAVVSLILILPPIIYQYSYPSISDDVPSYLQVIQKVGYGDLGDKDSYSFCYPTHYSGGEYCRYRNAAPAFVGLIVRILQTDPYWTYYIFHYLMLVVIAICVWLFCTKVFNRLTGYIGTLFVLFGATPVLRYSLYDQIFNIMNWLVFGLMGSLALIYYIRTKRLYYGIISLMLFWTAIVFHSSTGLEIYLSVGFFLVCACVYKMAKKDWRWFKGLSVYTLIYSSVGFVLIWTLCTEARSLFTAVLIGGSVKYDSGIHSVVPVYYFFMQDTSLILLVIGAYALIYLLRKKLVGIGLWMMLAYGTVLAVSIMLNKIEPARSAQDLGIILLIIYSGAIGTALYYLRNMPKIIEAKKTMIFIALVICVPVLIGWFQYHCCITQVDEEAIAQINRLGGSWNCSTQINPDVYKLFIKTEYKETGADYTIYRSKNHTAATDPNNRYTIVQGNASQLSDYNYYQWVWQWDNGDFKIIIFDNNKQAPTYCNDSPELCNWAY